MKSKCAVKCSHSKIKVGDSGKHIVIKNSGKSEYTIYDIDGCIVTEGRRADKIVRAPKAVDVILEFKGGDIEGAAKQIEATAEFWLQKKYGERPLHGCIISTHTPAFNSTIQRVRLAHRKVFGGNFTLRKPFKEYAFSTLIGGS